MPENRDWAREAASALDDYADTETNLNYLHSFVVRMALALDRAQIPLD